MLDIAAISHTTLRGDPYDWAEIQGTVTARGGAALAATYPRDRFKTVAGPADAAAQILPLVGNSSVLVRSDRSWHAVQPVAEGSQRSRRSVTVTFYRSGAVSTMWPPGDVPALHSYDPAGLDAG